MVLLLAFILSIAVVFVIAGIMFSAPSYKGPVSDHFNGKKFINPGNIKEQSLFDVMKWMRERKRGSWNELKTAAYGKHPLAREKENIRVTFVNHSTFLIQADGLNILTDPVWGFRVSPFAWAGPKRMRPPGIRFEDLPRIDAVLLSHNHYDHLDLPTMRTIFGGHHPAIITPLGVKAFLDQQMISGAADLDWWEEKKLSDSVSVQCVPAQHFSGRGAFDRNETLWCGYVLKTSKGNIYFAGDTGYNDKTFKEIGKRFGKMKISLLPIGAYKPVWFMHPVHTSPEDSVIIHKEVGSEKSIGTHIGTFALGDEGQSDPVDELKRACAKHHLNENDFFVLKEGDVYIAE